MQAITFLKNVEHLHKPVFSLQDAAKMIEKKKGYARLYLYRLKRKEYIKEIEKGKYSISDDIYEIASNVVFPSYISFLSAFSLYGLTTQIPKRIQIIAAKPKKELIVDDSTIEFITFKNKNIFGYERTKIGVHYGMIAEKEKAIIDALYLPQHCPISETFEVLKNKEFDIDKLVDYALQMDSIILLKRLGYLLELVEFNIFEKVKHKLNQRYDLLNPFLPASNKECIKSMKWKLIINEVLE
ncbi:hypothetical protein HZA96_02195 [Candidatus Woesearchaeota archaeon]|nr:hypothetical protein [Candidatus Woesearchaeota archaeon]